MLDMIYVLLTAIIVSSASALAGSFLVVRQQSMIGDAVSHTVLLGMVLAFLLTHQLGSLSMFIGAVVIGMVTTILIQLLEHLGIQSDAAIGMIFTSLFALGVLLISFFARDVHMDLDHVLFGEIAYVPWDRLYIGTYDLGPRALWTSGSVLILDILFVLLFFKPLYVASFDPSFARHIGFSPRIVHYMMMFFISLTAVVAFDAVGAILTVAMLITPGATSVLLTNRLPHTLFLSIFIGILSATIGYGFAAWLDVSISGSMAVSAGLFFALVYVFAPRYGRLRRYRQKRS
ncbi:MAG: metal ABC transporter permease [Candidatus Carbobacillus sp.]|nr:metal ABC transporter permease [Candidatus Carbobacillus sp.]